MLPVLLVAEEAKEVKKYIADFIKTGQIPESAIFRYYKDNTVITIEQIREIKTHLARAAPSRLFILYDFETAKKEAQNAFLKTLEERQEKVYFILVAVDLGSILPTVISRCAVRRLKGKSQPRSKSLDRDQKSAVDFELNESLACLFSKHTVSDRDKAARRHDHFLAFLRPRMRSDPEVTKIIREILKTRRLIVKNNLNPQAAVDHCLILAKNLLTKTS